MTLSVVDPHIHLWDLSTGLYPGLETPSVSFTGTNAPIARSYLIDEFLREGGEEVEVTAAVHVEAFPTDPVGEARMIHAVAETGKLPLGLVAYSDLSSLGAAATLEQLAAFPEFRGIRQVLNRHPNPLYNYVPRDFMHEPAWREGFALLERYGASFDLQIYPHQALDAAAIVARHPGMTVIVNHALMWADRNLDGWRQWKTGLRALAGLPNVNVKISGLGMLDRTWSLESIRPLVLEVLDVFGVERSMFASNFPVDKLFSDFPTVWRAFAAIVAGFSESEQTALFSANARRIYRLGASGG